MNFKGITCGTYYDKRAKKIPGTNKKYNKSICAECKLNKSGKENIDNEEQYNICKSCDKFYVSKSCKALLTIGRDQTTGKVKRKTFIGETEEEAFSKALQSKLKLDEEGGPRIITKTNKTLKELVEPILNRGVVMGEGWLLPAEVAELIELGYNNVICVQPFGCLPNHIVGKGTIRVLREKYKDANIFPIDYDSSASTVNQENRIKLMLSMAREKM